MTTDNPLNDVLRVRVELRYMDVDRESLLSKDHIGLYSKKIKVLPPAARQLAQMFIGCMKAYTRCFAQILELNRIHSKVEAQCFIGMDALTLRGK
jgi:hypothetical protein